MKLRFLSLFLSFSAMFYFFFDRNAKILTICLRRRLGGSRIPVNVRISERKILSNLGVVAQSMKMASRLRREKISFPTDALVIAGSTI